MSYERINDSLKEWYTYGKSFLQEKGIADAKTDAWLLLEYVTNITKSFYYLHMHDMMEEDERALYEQLLEKRGERIPLQYLTEEAWCYGNCFYVNHDVLIPRQDTEILIEEAAGRIMPGMRVLDLCTGSGCILISLLRRKSITGVGSDVSEKALAVARRNAKRYKVRAEWVRSDLFESITEQFDMICSNPPYIPTRIIDRLEPEVRDHEPKIALDGGEDGLAFYRRIIRQAKEYLKENGYLIMEIGFDQGDAVQALLRRYNFRSVRVVQDYAKLDRVAIGRK